MRWRAVILVTSLIIWSCHPDELESKACCNFHTTVHHFEVLGQGVPENLDLTIGCSWLDGDIGIEFVIPHEDDQAFEDCLNAIKPSELRMAEKTYRRYCSRLNAYCNVDLSGASEGKVIPLVNDQEEGLSMTRNSCRLSNPLEYISLFTGVVADDAEDERATFVLTSGSAIVAKRTSDEKRFIFILAFEPNREPPETTPRYAFERWTVLVTASCECTVIRGMLPQGACYDSEFGEKTSPF